MLEGAPSHADPGSFDPWQLLVESILDYAIFVLDPEGRIESWNRGAQLIKGYAPSEIIGKHFSIFYPASDIAAGKPERELEIATQYGRVEDEGIRLRKDGSRFWASVVITALRDQTGKLQGFAKVTRDQTTRRAADEHLRRSEERFRVLVESVSDYAIYMLDPDGVIATWNRGAEKLKGYTAAEIIGKHISTFFVEKDRAEGRPQRELEVAKVEGRFEEESFRVRKDGSRFWANVVVTPVYDRDGKHLGFAKVTRDLSARLQAHQTALELAREQAARAAAEEAKEMLRQAAHSADEANRVKDEFLATVSHELRTPLSAILGWAAVLTTGTLEANAARAAAAIHRNALAQRKIIEDILDVSRIITGKLNLEPRPLDLITVVQEAIEVVRPSATAKQIAIDFATPAEPCLLLGDADRLQQVAWNLLSNAIKFSSAGAHVDISVQASTSELTLSISDTGEGIDPAFLPAVFDRFKQADGSSTRRHGGLGLGLAIVRHLVELHGGRVEAHSRGLGLGATFKIVLPYCPPDTGRPPEESPWATPAVLGAEAPLRNLRVVVVDDEEDSRDLTAVILARAGAEVRTAASAGEGLAEVRSFRPHVLVSDLGMPHEDGYSLVRRLVALEPSEGGGVPALALTAYASDRDRTKAYDVGFRAYLCKPLEPDALVAAVAGLAGHKPSA